MSLFRIPFFVLFAFFINSLVAQPYNKALIARLDTILAADQQYRSLKAAIGSKEDEENMRKQDAVDYQNLQKVEKIFAAYGYPGKSLVGTKHQATAFLVIQHSDLEKQEKYLPLLTKAAAKGELRKSSLAILIDRVRTAKGEKQVYGSQTRETDKGIKIMPIADEPNVNVRRAKVGLAPLEVYLKHWNIIYKVPTAAHPNPADWYYSAKEAPSVEAVGGDEAIIVKLTYPAQAKENKITGLVTIQFTVDTAGRTKNVMVVKSLGYGCDEEAVRVIKEAQYTNNTGGDHEMRMGLPFPNTK